MDGRKWLNSPQSPPEPAILWRENWTARLQEHKTRGDWPHGKVWPLGAYEVQARIKTPPCIYPEIMW